MVSYPSSNITEFGSFFKPEKFLCLPIMVVVKKYNVNKYIRLLKQSSFLILFSIFYFLKSGMLCTLRKAISHPKDVPASQIKNHWPRETDENPA